MADATKDDTGAPGARKLSGVPMGLDEALRRLANAVPPPPELSSSDAVYLHCVALPWARREDSINRLEKAAIDGDLRFWLQLRDGRRFDLASWKWRESQYRRETIISGVWCEPASDHDRLSVFVDEAAFEAWRNECASVHPGSPVSAEPSQSVSPEPPPPEPSNVEPKTRRARLILVMTELGLPFKLKPAQVEQRTKVQFHARWPDEAKLTIDNRRTTTRAYEEYVASRSSK